MSSFKAITLAARKIHFWTIFTLSAFRSMLFLAAFCHILSQITKMGSFLLPIKVLYIASTPSIPNYLTNFAPQLSREQFVLGLSAISILLFVLHVVFEWARNALDSSVFTSLFTKLEHRTGLLKRQHARALFRHSQALISGLAFSILLIALLCKIAPNLIWLLVLLVIGFTILIQAFDKKLQHSWGSSPQSPATIIGIVCAIGFLSGFAMILYTLLNQHETSVLVAIVSLISFRLLMNQIAMIANAVNYHGKLGIDVSLHTDENPDKQRTDFLQNECSIIGSTLEEQLLKKNSSDEELEIRTKKIDSVSSGIESYLIQHSKNSNNCDLLTIATHSEEPRTLDDKQILLHSLDLSPAVLSCDSRDGKIWTVFEGPIFDIPLDEHPSAKRKFLIRLASTSIEMQQNNAISDAFQYKKLSLAELGNAIAKYDANTELLKKIERALDISKEILDTLPHQLQLRSNQGALVYNQSKNIPLAYHTGNACLVPVGMSFEGETLIFDPVEIVKEAAQYRSCLKEIPDINIQVAYEIGRLHAALKRGRSSSVFHITNNIVKLTELHNSQHISI